MKYRILALVILCSLAKLFRAQATDDRVVIRYRFGTQENLGQVLNSLGACPLWGRHGIVARTRNANPALEPSNGNEVSEKEVIVIPVSVEELPKGSYTFAADGTILPTDKTAEYCAPKSKIETTSAAYETDEKDSEATRLIERAPAATVAAAQPTPSPEPAPSPVASAQSAPEENRYSLIEISPETGFYKIDATDSNSGSKARILSDPAYGIGLAWKQVWSPRWGSFASFRLLTVPYRQAKTGTSLEGDRQSYSTIEAGAEATLDDQARSSLGASLGIEQLPYLVSLGTTNVGIVKVNAPRARLWFRHEFIPVEPLGLGAELSLRGMFPSSTDSFDARAALGFGGRLFVQQKLGASLLGLGLVYEQLSYDSSIVKQKSATLGLGVSLQLKLGQ